MLEITREDLCTWRNEIGEELAAAHLGIADIDARIADAKVLQQSENSRVRDLHDAVGARFGGTGKPKMAAALARRYEARRRLAPGVSIHQSEGARRAELLSSLDELQRSLDQIDAVMAPVEPLMLVDESPASEPVTDFDPIQPARAA
jgi:hypothetical protein